MGERAEKHGVSCPPWFRNLAHIASEAILQSVSNYARLFPNDPSAREKNHSKESQLFDLLPVKFCT
jgi:hypothetical protein